MVLSQNFCGMSGSEKQPLESRTIHSKTKRPRDRVSVNYFEFLKKISRVSPFTQNSSDFEDSRTFVAKCYDPDSRFKLFSRNFLATGNQSLQTSCLLESLSRTWKCFLAL